MPLDPPSRHANLCVRECAFARYYHPATILFSPQLKILYETLTVVSFSILCTEILGRTSMRGDSCKRCPIHLARRMVVTPYVGMTLKKNGGYIKSAQMTRSKCLCYISQRLPSAISGITACFHGQRDHNFCWKLSLKYQTGKSPKLANRLSSDFFLSFFVLKSH